MRLHLTGAPGMRSGALLALLLLGASSVAGQNYPPSEYQNLARDIFRELIEINTTDSSGDNTEAARTMADRLLAVGFPAEDVQVVEGAPRKGNLIARLRGRDSGRRPILLLAHIDVVEADAADCNLDPFTFVERDGWFYGIGVPGGPSRCRHGGARHCTSGRRSTERLGLALIPTSTGW